ncbi:MAG: xanthine dehydrogenase family protein subunit M [Anaerolineales bacterium]
MTTYHRPTTLEEALEYLSQSDAVPLGGGTTLAQRTHRLPRIVDLQNAGLDDITVKGSRMEAGATGRLQALLEHASTPPVLRQVLHLEAPPNLRNMRTLAGALLTADGRSPFAAVMMALDASVRRITFADDGTPQAEETVSVGHLLLERVTAPARRQLLLGFNLPLNVRLGFAHVARTPSDRPILDAALVQWPSGRTRLVMGGWGTAPTLAMDGSGAEGLPAAARNACYEAADAFASAEYRREVGPTLAQRALRQVMDD